MNLKNPLSIEPEKVSKKIENFIKEKVNGLNRNGVIIGLSGGIDSVVLAYLAVNAVGKENVMALLMPERDSSKEHLADAELIADKLGIEKKIINIAPLLKDIGTYKTLPGRFLTNKFRTKTLYSIFSKITRNNLFSGSIKGSKQKYVAQGTAYYRVKHRLRMALLYYYGEFNNLLMVGSANKTEHLTGFFVKYGIDHATDIMPLQGLYKTQIRQLADYLGVPEHIIKKSPSPDLIPGVTDEGVFGINYDKLDLILYYLEKKFSSERIAKNLSINKAKVDSIMQMFRDSQHMRDQAYEPRI